MRISKSGIIRGTFTLLVITALMQYIPYALASIATGTYVHWTYANASFDLGFAGNFIYLKDFFSVLLFLLLFSQGGRLKRKAVMFGFIVAWGGCIGFLTGNVSPLYMVAGVRQLLLFFDVVLYVEYVDRKDLLLWDMGRKARLFIALAVVEFVIVFAGVAATGSFSSFGQGAMRFEGTLGNGGLLGYFAIGAMFIVLVASEVLGWRFRMWEMLGLLAAIFFTAIASGARTAIFLSYAILVFLTAHYFFGKLRVGGRKIGMMLMACVLLAVSAVPVYVFTLNYIDRGALAQSGSGRLDSFFRLVQESSNMERVFGHGLGCGTNAAVSLGERMGGLDGTVNAIFSQFGLVGTVLFLLGFVMFFVRFFKLAKSHRGTMAMSAVLFGCIIFIINIFEQSVLMLMVVYGSYATYRLDRRGHGSEDSKGMSCSAV